jgi:hypothetical protein
MIKVHWLTTGLLVLSLIRRNVSMVMVKFAGVEFAISSSLLDSKAPTKKKQDFDFDKVYANSSHSE